MYKFIHFGNMVIAITTYAGKTVKAYAKCHSDDTFDVEFGENLAKARCDVKVAKKRAARAKKKYAEAIRALAQAQIYEANMQDYLMNSDAALTKAQENLDTLIASIQ